MVGPLMISSVVDVGIELLLTAMLAMDTWLADTWRRKGNEDDSVQLSVEGGGGVCCMVEDRDLCRV